MSHFNFLQHYNRVKGYTQSKTSLPFKPSLPSIPSLETTSTPIVESQVKTLDSIPHASIPTPTEKQLENSQPVLPYSPSLPSDPPLTNIASLPNIKPLPDIEVLPGGKRVAIVRGRQKKLIKQDEDTLDVDTKDDEDTLDADTEKDERLREVKNLEVADFAETTKIYEIKGKLNKILDRLAPDEQDTYLNIVNSWKPTRAQLENLNIKTNLEKRIQEIEKNNPKPDDPFEINFIRNSIIVIDKNNDVINLKMQLQLANSILNKTNKQISVKVEPKDEQVTIKDAKAELPQLENKSDVDDDKLDDDVLDELSENNSAVEESDVEESDAEQNELTDAQKYVKSLGPFQSVDLAANNVNRTYILFLKGKASSRSRSTLIKLLSESPEYHDEAPSMFKGFGTKLGETKYSKDKKVAVVLWDKRIKRKFNTEKLV